MIMKTKHFLITTEDGSAVAVVNDHKCDLGEKVEMILREQLDSPYLHVLATMIGDGYISFVHRKDTYESIQKVIIKRIELY